MNSLLILNAKVINEGQIQEKDVFVKNGRIEQIGSNLSHLNASKVIDATGQYLMPGVIDDQVHFREPGLTHKANIYTEACAAVAGGTTSFMEMPNTVPNTLTQALLEQKYQIAAQHSLANYSFFMGVSNDNYEEAMKTDIQNICGLKIFMGSSTGNMLVDNEAALEKIFANANLLIATHCEDEATVKANLRHFKEKYGENLPADIHAIIRNEDACFKSSSMAVELAKKHNTRLHILHISSSEELALFSDAPLNADKRITAEVCVHHLWFDAKDYERLGSQIKCNPAIKHQHRENLLAALLANRLDIIATDHAPHTWEEKNKSYWEAPAGLPLVQHALNMMLDFYHQGKISLEKIAEKMCHAPAQCFQIAERGYVREGYWADLVLVDLDKETEVKKENILMKCAWSPLENHIFQSAITHTIVSGNLVYENGIFNENKKGRRLQFARF